jgi:uncharacterized protein (DUF362 family)
MNIKPTVVIEKLQDSTKSLEDQIDHAADIIGLKSVFKGANAIFIKPNLTYPVYKEGVTTRKEFVESLVSVLRQYNNTTKIYIGEGEGGYNSFSMTKAMYSMGFFEIEKRFDKVKIINLSEIPRKTVVLTANNQQYPVDLPEIFFSEIDFSVSCPLPKIHDMTLVTLSLKNQWGCLPDTMRLKNHYVFDDIIPQVARALKFKYALLDGKFGLDINGPITGILVNVNWFVAANSLGAFDLVVSELMGIDWKKVGHLTKAREQGLVPDIRDIVIHGTSQHLKRKFKLKRTFWSYPALIAFQSSRLTYFAYLSRYSKILHDIMYSFRKREM